MFQDQAFAPVAAILLLAITIALAGTATIVFDFEGTEDTVAAGFLVREGGQLEILKTGGQSLETERVLFRIGTPNGTADVPADTLPGLGETWTNGQGVCLAGEGSRCLRIAGADRVIDVRIVYDSQLLYEWVGDAGVDDLRAGGGPWTGVDLGDPVADPGHAYEDLDNDGRFTPGLDEAVANATIADGTYHVADSWGLVVPASVDPIDADEVNLSAGEDGHVVVETDITGGTGGVNISAGDGVRVEDRTIDSANENIVLDAGDGDLDVAGTAFDTGDQRVELRADGDLDARKATFTADQERVVIDVDGSVDLEGARISASELISIDAGGDVTLQDAMLSADEEVTIEAVAEATIDAASVRIDDADDTALVTPDTAVIEGEPLEGDVVHG